MSLKKLMFEEIRKFYGLREIGKMGQVKFAVYEMFMNFVALTFAAVCVKHELFSFPTKL